jgi:hypothetical protein
MQCRDIKQLLSVLNERPSIISNFHRTQKGSVFCFLVTNLGEFITWRIIREIWYIRIMYVRMHSICRHTLTYASTMYEHATYPLDLGNWLFLISCTRFVVMWMFGSVSSTLYMAITCFLVGPISTFRFGTFWCYRQICDWLCYSTNFTNEQISYATYGP